MVFVAGRHGIDQCPLSPISFAKELMSLSTNNCSTRSEMMPPHPQLNLDEEIARKSQQRQMPSNIEASGATG
jgi:hypothetical protein